VVLCERGIRTFETYTRNTLDISAVPAVKKLTHLPVIVDPSHATGIRALVSPAALAAIAGGADGLTVEVHPNPDAAMSDGPQSLLPDQFEKLMRDIEAIAPVVGKELLRLPRQKMSEGQVSRDRPLAEPAASADSRVPVVAFSGRSGAFAERALINAFGEDAPRLPVPSFSGIFDAVLDGRAAFGMVPVENSLSGSIHENYDLFMRYPDVTIQGEIKLRVVHCLIAREGMSIDKIKTVRSHPQGFSQCRDFLDKHPAWQMEIWPTTADAVLSLTKNDAGGFAAAIASEEAAKSHGLAVLKAGIENNPLNYTRFYIIMRKEAAPQAGSQALPQAAGANKASIIFSVRDEPGSLFECLKLLNDNGINLHKLESRPILGKPWRYLFYVDVNIPNSGIFDAVMETLTMKTKDFRLLGTYREAL
jgi:3-deoxy-7-phosphoheptulonate synthase